MVEFDKENKVFKYQRDCKLPFCKKPFGTNRDWQYFCPKTEDKNCQQEWQRLLRKKHEDVIVEIEILKENFLNMEKTIKTVKETFEEFRKAVGKITLKEVE